MPSDDVDVVVIGMGPGGEAVATRLAEAGLRVAGVEGRLVGGECPYYACVPTKMMVRGADALAETRRVSQLAGTAEAHPDWTRIADRIRDEAATGWDDQEAVRRFEGSGGQFVRGLGRITAPGEVTVAASSDAGDRVLRARRGIVLNPGTEPAIPPIDGLEGTPFWTNREAVRTRAVPRSLIVLGGGPVGLELSQVFARFGADTALVEAGPRLLRHSEPAASERITAVFENEGIAVHTGTSARRVRYLDGRFSVDLSDGTTRSAECLLVATGRRSDLAALGVGAVGIDDSARTIAVDERMRAAEGVWAVGDVTGKGAFTHTSVYQAGIAAADILGEEGATADYRAEPAVTFTDPEIAEVGLTEARARERGVAVRTGSAEIPATVRGWIHKAGNDGVITLVADADRGVLVGATVVAPSGGEVLGALAVAIHAEVPVAQLRRMMFAYPAFHRGIGDALADLP